MGQCRFRAYAPDSAGRRAQAQVLSAGQADQPTSELLKIHQYDLAAEGKALLEREARAASFFLIGGLHGDKETPALVDSLWPTIGYRYLAAEMSPWAASRMKVPHLRGSDVDEGVLSRSLSRRRRHAESDDRVRAESPASRHRSPRGLDARQLHRRTRDSRRRRVLSRRPLRGRRQDQLLRHPRNRSTKGRSSVRVFASAARYPATVFDVRPIRRALHQIATDKLSATDAGLLYWADSYDAIVCYREVTPAGQ